MLDDLNDARFRPPLAPPAALLAGAIGRTGEALLNALVASERYAKLHVLTRQTLVSAHQSVGDWCVPGRLDDETLTLAPPPPVQDAFLLLGGSRLHSARDRAARELMQQDVAPLARVLAAAGARRLFLVCPIGPMAQMSAFQHFYAVEAMPMLAKLPFEKVAVLLPIEVKPPSGARGLSRLLEAYLDQMKMILQFGNNSLSQTLTSERFAEAVLKVADDPAPGISLHNAQALRQLLGIVPPKQGLW